MSSNLLKNALAQKSFWILSKLLLAKYGPNTATLLSVFIDKSAYHNTDDGWFFHKRENIEQEICMTAHEQRKSIERLQQDGLVEVKRIGLPARNYYRVNESNLFNLLNNTNEA